jgi:hypothetical protein
MAFTYALDATVPAPTRAVKLGDDDIRYFKNDVRERVNSFFVDVDTNPWVIKSGARAAAGFIVGPSDPGGTEELRINGFIRVSGTILANTVILGGGATITGAVSVTGTIAATSSVTCSAVVATGLVTCVGVSSTAAITTTSVLVATTGAYFRGTLIGLAATTGHFLIPSCSGTPTGVPTTGTGPNTALQYDTTTDKLWAYNGSWKSSPVFT